MPSTEKVAPGKPCKNGAPPAEIAGAEHRNIKPCLGFFRNGYSGAPASSGSLRRSYSEASKAG